MNFIFSGKMLGISTFKMGNISETSLSAFSRAARSSVNSSTLTAIIKDPVIISANEVWVSSDSSIIIDTTKLQIANTFRYDNDPFFEFKSPNKNIATTNFQLIAPPRQADKFSIGFYDYDTVVQPVLINGNLKLLVGDGELNKKRASINTLSIPLLMSAQTLISDIVFNHIKFEPAQDEISKNYYTVSKQSRKNLFNFWIEPAYNWSQGSLGNEDYDIKGYIAAGGIDISIEQYLTFG